MVPDRLGANRKKSAMDLHPAVSLPLMVGDSRVALGSVPAPSNNGLSRARRLTRLERAFREVGKRAGPCDSVAQELFSTSLDPDTGSPGPLWPDSRRVERQRMLRL